MTDRMGWGPSASASNSSESLRETSLPGAAATAGIEASQPQVLRCSTWPFQLMLTTPHSRLQSSDSTRVPSTSDTTAKVTRATTYSQCAVSKSPSASHIHVNDQHTNAIDAAPLNTAAQKEAGMDSLPAAKSTGDIHRANDKQNDNDLQKATRLPSSDKRLAEDAVDVSTPWDGHGTPARFN
ncbi:hypothetical protein CORC01_09782 [Colletotrichum orchidophilum]|uniref:Uncharacterized protein n=1 Tax=Colletotrichum orchidophilum TaxID=1209926 RepID=A0A1G4B0K4_9PEZI|nr:uncharacterized protein CORC01_09782 [Colletotrichum orchidophilum]OHE94863.1 hypothetical protein CORC01_09782 [Colletotrichum orchidophilum]